MDVREILDAMGHVTNAEGEITVDGRDNWVDMTIPVKVKKILQSPFGPTTVVIETPFGEIEHIPLRSIVAVESGLRWLGEVVQE